MSKLVQGEDALIEELVTANLILAHQGVVDGFGHVSARCATRPDRYLLSRSMPPEHVTSGDILEFTLESDCVTPGDHKPFLERFIHGEIYRTHPEVVAVVHSHSQSVIPMGATKAEPLRAIYHMGAFLGVATPVFEIRDAGGEATDMLVRNRPLGAALASKLADSAVILMRGHGATIVGASLRQAVFRAVYTEINARLQAQAMQIGDVTYLNSDEAKNAAQTNDEQGGRAWDLWKAQAERSLGR